MGLRGDWFKVATCAASTAIWIATCGRPDVADVKKLQRVPSPLAGMHQSKTCTSGCLQSMWWDSCVRGLDLDYTFIKFGATSGVIVCTSEVRCPARRTRVNAREWRNNASEVATSTCFRMLVKVRMEGEWRVRSLAFKRRWRMCSSSFRTTCSRSFVLMQTFFLFLFLTDKIRKAVKAIYLLISVQVVFFHALWLAIFLSFYFSQQ